MTRNQLIQITKFAVVKERKKESCRTWYRKEIVTRFLGNGDIDKKIDRLL